MSNVTNVKVASPEASLNFFNKLMVNSKEGWDQRISLKLQEYFSVEESHIMYTTYSGIWSMLGNDGTVVQTDKVKKLVDRLVKGFSFIEEPYDCTHPATGEEYTFCGNVFSAMVQKVNGKNDGSKKIKIAINPLIKEMLMTQREKDIIYNIDEADKLGYTSEEIIIAKEKFKDHNLLGGKDLDYLKGNRYAQRLYQVLMEHRQYDGSSKRWNVSIDNFKKALMIPKSYVINDIKRKILEPSRKLLKDVGMNITRLEYSKAKGSRSFTSMTFTFNYNPIKGYDIALESITKKMMKNKSFLYDFRNIAINGSDLEYKEFIRNEYVHSYNISPKVYDTKEFKEKTAFAMLELLQFYLTTPGNEEYIDVKKLKNLVLNKEDKEKPEVVNKEKCINDYTEQQIHAAMVRCSEEGEIPIKFLEDARKRSTRTFMITIKKYL